MNTSSGLRFVARCSLTFLCLLGLPLLAAERPIPPAFGPHVGLKPSDFAEAKSFRGSNRIVGTYYFYWYDAATKEHILDGDGTDALTTHPPSLEDFSYRSVTWHKRQLRDMIAAGIDVVLPVFWGAPSEHDSKANLHWSYVGIPPLVQAREELLREGAQPPRIGLFYDTSTLRHNAWREHVDLTTERGRRWFYATVRDFFSMVPPKHWAMIDGKPITLLYSASFAKGHDQGCIDFTKSEFPKEFAGRVPWIAREVSWRVQADSTVAWGGALGLKNPGVASVGPGYDHSAVPGRDRLVVEREGGAFYERQWEKFLRRPSNFVMVETWNEFHEGTDVAESKEYGRQYIELTRKYSDLFRQGWRPPVPKGKYTDAKSVSVTLAANNAEAGLKQIENDDGLTQPNEFSGRTARGIAAGASKGRYIYFTVDESFKATDPVNFTVDVNYFDAAPGTLALDFDGSDESAPFSGAYTRSPDSVKLVGDRRWKSATFRLPRARFLNGQNRGADFRFVVEAPAFAAGRVALRKQSGGDTAQVLFDFEHGRELISEQDAKARVASRGAGRVLRVETGHAQSWPGVTLRAPNGAWDLSSFAAVTLRVRNVGSNSVTVNCRVDNADADGTKHCVSGLTTVSPGAESFLRVPLKRHGESRLGGKLFGMRGYPVATGGDHTVDPCRITQLLLFVNKPTTAHAFEVDDIRSEGQFVPPTASVTDADPFIPFIDTFGQYRHRDWPGKVHSLDELKQRHADEAKELAVQSGPSEWNQFGGWKSGPQLAATGFFRTEKHAGKWWLVDPEGRLFWSHGIDCVRMLDATAIEEREDWFAEFPGAQPDLATFVSRGHVLKGHYAGRSVKTFSFAGANLQRKYGADWRGSFGDVVHRRLRNWGLNTIGNWSDETVRLQKRTPYVDAIGSGSARRIEGSEGYWGKFADPFDASFRESMRKSMAGKRGKSAGDPWCIGFFSDNEIAWGDELSLAIAALQSPSDQAAKRAFIADLQSKYGDIAKLNATWGASHVSWEALRESRTAPDKKRARTDLETFYTKIADAYFRTAREVIKEAAPNQLYLGCRFAWVNARAAAVAANYCDVVSYNLYKRSVADFQFNGGADVPLIIGEFHFGALDRGMFHTGLVPTASQMDRAQTYTNYVSGALRHSQFVGCHWFQYQDQPTTGRVYDEENYQIGFVDIADTPNREITDASRAVGAKMYQMRVGAQ